MSARRKSLLRSTSGAVAPTVALSLFGLIAAGGIAFDYARMAGLDSELQSAADQAALAAATQLDGSATAITRATNAAQNLIVNETRFANDGAASGRNIIVPTANLTFFTENYNPDTDTGTVTTDAAKARFVQVSVQTREAFYALTPVVRLFSSGQLSALAVAGVGSAACRVPPLMICIPSNFPNSADLGKGVRLQPGSGQDLGAWVPGDYGYLDFATGASGLAKLLGANEQNRGCSDSSLGIKTEPGNKTSVTAWLNTRFDIYEKNNVDACNPSTGDNCPAENVGKDFVKKEVVEFKDVDEASPPLNPGCGAVDGANGGKVTVTDFEQNSIARGFTRDICHTPAGSPACGSNFGDGTWDIASYFAANHPAEAIPSGVAARRFSVYQWELLNKSIRLPTKQLSTTFERTAKGGGKGGGGNITYTYTNYCAYPQPKNGTAVIASASQKDRRVLTVAGVDCAEMAGKDKVNIKKWIDVFLVEPSSGDRSSPYSTGKEQIYVEIIGVAATPSGGDGFQHYGRNRPYLLK